MDPAIRCRPAESRTPQRRPGLTQFESLVVIAAIGVLITWALPSFQAARNKSQRISSAAQLKAIGDAVHNYCHGTGQCPDEFSRLENYLDEELYSLVRRSEVGRKSQQLDPESAPPFDAVPYFVLSSRNEEFRIAIGWGADPLRYWGRDYVDLNALVYVPCPGGDCDPYITPAMISSYEVVTLDEFADVWLWDPKVKPPGGNSPRPFHDVANVLPTVRAAEMITALLADHPELIAQVRTAVDGAEVVGAALALFDSNDDDFTDFEEFLAGPGWSFADLLGPELDDDDEIEPLLLEDREGSPSQLFSYETVRVLSRFYVQPTGIYNSLAAKLDAAEAAEASGNSSANAGQIEAFQREVKAQMDKTLLPYQADVLLTFSSAL